MIFKWLNTLKKVSIIKPSVCKGDTKFAAHKPINKIITTAQNYLHHQEISSTNRGLRLLSRKRSTIVTCLVTCTVFVHTLSMSPTVLVPPTFPSLLSMFVHAPPRPLPPTVAAKLLPVLPFTTFFIPRSNVSIGESRRCSFDVGFECVSAVGKKN